MLHKLLKWKNSQEEMSDEESIDGHWDGFHNGFFPYKEIIFTEQKYIL